MHARYYNPNVARFLSVDPGRDNNLQVPQSWNLYAYVRNNPVNTVDRDGKFVWWAVAGAIAMAAMSTETSTAPMTPAQAESAAPNSYGGSAISAAMSGAGATLSLRAAVRLLVRKVLGFGRPMESFAGQQAGAPRSLAFSEKDLQKGFTKHGKDFGIVGNWGPGKGEEFRQAVIGHINKPGIETIGGTYRGNAVTHYLDRSTGLNVIADPSGNYVSGWRLSDEQLSGVASTGRLY